MKDLLKVAKIGQYDIQYLDIGQGTPVVLIHGLAGDYSAWTNQIQLLKAHYRVIAFDNRGAGKSSQVDEPISTQDLAKDTLGLMDVLQIQSAHIVGRSMGGAVAQYMALMSPERVKSLVLCASFAVLDPLGRRVLLNMREALEWRMNWADHARHSIQNFVSAQFFNTEQEQVKKIEALIGGETRLPACYIRQNEACQNHDTSDQLSAINQPTLVMAGKNDPICSLMATEILSKGIPNSQTILFDNASHFFLMEQSDKFNQSLQDWLNSH
jgi:3-oxoadipate enol-lactonase